MSWVRLGSRRCEDAPCTGSQVYVFDRVGGGVVCCFCSLHEEGHNTALATEEEMLGHLLEHHAAGSHVCDVFLREARGRLAPASSSGDSAPGDVER